MHIFLDIYLICIMFIVLQYMNHNNFLGKCASVCSLSKIPNGERLNCKQMGTENFGLAITIISNLLYYLEFLSVGLYSTYPTA